MLQINNRCSWLLAAILATNWTGSLLASPIINFTFEPAMISGSTVQNIVTPGTLDGTLVGSPVTTTGLSGNGLVFDGVNDKITVPYSAADAIGTGDFTIAMWIKPLNLLSQQTLLNRRVGSGNRELEVTIGGNAPNGKLWFLTGDAGGSTNVTSVSPLTFNVGTYLAFRRSGSTLSIFINGVLDNSTTGTLRSVDASGQLMNIGIFQGNDKYTGVMDDFRLYTAALTNAEIAALPEPGAIGVMMMVAGSAFLRKHQPIN